MKKFKVVGIGEILWDYFGDDKRIGGAPSNFSYHANRLGVDSVIISAVGDDKLGNEIINRIAFLGMNSIHIQRNPNYPTGKVTVDLDANGDPLYHIHENVAWDFIKYENHFNNLSQWADAVCYGTLAQRGMVSRETIRKFLANTNEKTLKVFDVNLRHIYYSRTLITDLLEYADVVKCDEEEFKIVCNLCCDSDDPDITIRCLIEKYNLKLFAYTLGNKGSYLYTPNSKSFMEAETVNVVDSVGAGDAFTAAITVGLLERKSLDEIHKLASKLAGYVCTQKGAMPEYKLEDIL